MRKFVVSRPDLQEMLKEVLQNQGIRCKSEIQISIGKGRLLEKKKMKVK